jgi:hypothetical protein
MEECEISKMVFQQHCISLTHVMCFLELLDFERVFVRVHVCVSLSVCLCVCVCLYMNLRVGVFQSAVVPCVRRKLLGTETRDSLFNFPL